MQKIKARGLGFLIILIVGAWLAIAQAGGGSTASASANAQTPLESSQQAPVVAPSFPPGSPAITPHIHAADASTPTFTSDDVAQYVMSHPVFRASVSGQFTILQIRFMTSGSLSALLGGESIGRPDNALVCYVELKGTFIFLGPQGTTKTAHIAYEVFDAHTGNLLMSGGKA